MHGLIGYAATYAGIFEVIGVRLMHLARDGIKILDDIMSFLKDMHVWEHI